MAKKKTVFYSGIFIMAAALLLVILITMAWPMYSLPPMPAIINYTSIKAI
jgi:hypothetical protein